MREAVAVTLADGTVHRASCERPPGFWGAPLDLNQHREKVHDCLATRLAAGRVARVVQLLESLEDLPADGVRELSLLLE